jgi:predicted cupin superfamily sugar epimerase
VHERAAHLIRSLHLAPHPEGGHFAEVFRSALRVRPADGSPERPALTTIYFLLAAGEQSRWHRVSSDEVWHFYEGEPLELLSAPGEPTHVEVTVLGPLSGDGRGHTRSVHTVPAGWWQAARPLGAWSLVGCTVAPGFDFADFTMLSDDPARARLLAERFPQHASLV